MFVILLSYEGWPETNKTIPSAFDPDAEIILCSILLLSKPLDKKKASELIPIILIMLLETTELSD